MKQSPPRRRRVHVEPSPTAVSLAACLAFAALGRTRATPRCHNAKRSGVRDARPDAKGGRGRSRVGREEHAASHDVAIVAVAVVAARLPESMTESRFPTATASVLRANHEARSALPENP